MQRKYMMNMMRRKGRDSMNKRGRCAAKIVALALAAVLVPAAGLRAEDPKPPAPLTM